MSFILVATGVSGSFKRGEIALAKDNGVFGRLERLPNFLRVEVTDATAAQVQQYLARITTILEYSVLDENPARWDVLVQIDPKIIAATNIGAEFAQAFEDWLLGPHPTGWTATVINSTSTSRTVRISKSFGGTLQEIQDEADEWFQDKLSEDTGFQRYRIAESNLSTSETAGAALEAANEDGEGNIPGTLIHESTTSGTLLLILVDRLA